jgi:hypothetical protein
VLRKQIGSGCSRFPAIQFVSGFDQQILGNVGG